MPRTRDRSDAPPACSATDCGDDAAFFLYDAEAGDWRGVCERHARHHHPSLEVHAWLTSGYMKPVEVGRPEGPPPEPRGGRQAAFRAEVAETMGWNRDRNRDRDQNQDQTPDRDSDLGRNQNQGRAQDRDRDSDPDRDRDRGRES